jgi:hypothetical protein
MSTLLIVTFISMYLGVLLSGKIAKIELLSFKFQTGSCILAVIGTTIWFSIYSIANFAGFI